MSGRAMRPASRTLVVVSILAVGCWGLLQWPVQTRRGVNYDVTAHAVPLYVKLARFLYRDMEYRQLVRQLIAGIPDRQERVVRLYEWVRTHLRSGVPAGMPVIDDHVWDIIVRGYGTPDQLADVLATLCAYAQVPAELVMFGPPGQGPLHTVTMVQLEGRWCPVDPYYGVMVRDAEQRLLSREELLAQPELLRRAAPGVRIHGMEYAQLYAWLPEIRPDAELRPYRHMPVRRTWYELRRMVRRLSERS